MDKKLIVALVAALSVLLIAGLATAQGMWKNKESEMGMQGMHGNMMKGMMQHHEEMEKVMEEGTYADLVKLREENSFNIMPWVENEEDFQLAKKMHEKMEKYREDKGLGAGHCPMMG